MPETPQPRLGDRSLFPALSARAYLNHAAMAPPSVPVLCAVEQFMSDHAAGGASAFGRWHVQREILRADLATMMGCGPEDLGFVANTTAGVTHVALGFPWEPGDGVLLFEGEFPANVTPWQRAADLYGLDARFASLAPYARSHEEGVQALEALLVSAPCIRLVAVSAVQFQTGLRMPVARMAEVCHAHGAELFVDGIQACGAVPLDVRASGIDYLSTGGHKWLMGVMGAGALYVRPDRVAKLRPVTAGWASHQDPFDFLLRGPGHLRYDRPVRTRADFVEGGSPGGVACAALGAAVALLLELGVDRIFAHVGAYLDRLEGELLERGFASLRAAEPEARSTLLSVTPPAGVDGLRLQAALASRGASVAYPDGILRWSPHWPNGLGEVDGVLSAVDEALAEERKRA
jgi:cysteine desulfurase / selenocysteine lyase